MFWNTEYTPSPHIDSLLSKEVRSYLKPTIELKFLYQILIQDVKIEELLDDDEILQEYKWQNKRLVQ